MDSEVYAVTVCVLIHRGDSWLLVVRAPGVAYAPNMIGMIGGHVDLTRPLAGVLLAGACYRSPASAPAHAGPAS